MRARPQKPQEGCPALFSNLNLSFLLLMKKFKKTVDCVENISKLLFLNRFIKVYLWIKL